MRGAERTVRIAAAQTVEFREDIDAALHCLLELSARAEREGAALLCFPEGFLQGYLTDEVSVPARALDLASPRFAAVLERFPKTGPMIVVGVIEVAQGRFFNTAVVVHRGTLVGRYRKIHLLDGEQIFDGGDDVPIFEAEGLRFGINFCHDTKFAQPSAKIAAQGSVLIVCPANNMMQREAAQTWRDAHNAIRGERCRETGLWLISADVTGERGGMIALGPTAVLSPAGDIAAQLPLGAPGLLIFDMPCQSPLPSRSPT